LKKQSQFASSQIGLSYFLKGNYGKMALFETLKNKPNSKPICRLLAGNPKQKEKEDEKNYSNPLFINLNQDKPC
jgi:hypothetical protein